MENNELIYVVINAALYVGLFLFLLLQKQKSTIAIFLASVWSVSAIFSIYYYVFLYSTKYGAQVNPITLLPFIYLFVLVFAFFLPAINIKDKSIHQVTGNYHFLRAIAILAILINILPFIENVIYAMSNATTNMGTFADQYGSEDKYDHLSNISRTFYRYSTYLRVVLPIILFYFLQFYEKNKILVIGLLMSVFSPIIGSLNAGSRFVMVTDVLYFVVIYLLFKNTIDKQIRKKIIKVFSIGGSLLAVVFVAITIFRFANNKADDIWVWVSLYAGESFLNFNSEMWDLTQFTDGDNSIYLIRHWLGEYHSNIRSSEFLAMKVPIRTFVFYTFVGNFYMDFGKYITFFIIVLLSCYFYMKSRKCSTNTPIHILMLLGLYFKMLASGFTFFTYVNNQETVPYSLIIIFFVYLSSKQKRT